MTIKEKITTLVLVALTWGCGTDAEHSANPVGLSIDVTPFAIDSGDQTKVTINVSNIEAENFAIKVRFPKALEYVYESSTLILDGEDYDTGPITRVASTDHNYVIYFFESDDFPDGNGIVTLLLSGVSDLPAGVVEVDADLDDPEQDNDEEFKADDARFTGQDQDDFRVGPAPAETPSSTSGR